MIIEPRTRIDHRRFCSALVNRFFLIEVRCTTSTCGRKPRLTNLVAEDCRHPSESPTEALESDRRSYGLVTELLLFKSKILVFNFKLFFPSQRWRINDRDQPTHYLTCDWKSSTEKPKCHAAGRRSRQSRTMRHDCSVNITLCSRSLVRSQRRSSGWARVGLSSAHCRWPHLFHSSCGGTGCGTCRQHSKKFGLKAYII